MKEYYFRLMLSTNQLSNEKSEWLISTYDGTRSNAMAYFRRKIQRRFMNYIRDYNAVFYVDQFESPMSVINNEPFMKRTPLKLRATQIGQ